MLYYLVGSSATSAYVEETSCVVIDNSEHKHKKITITAPDKSTVGSADGYSMTVKYRVNAGSWVTLYTAKELDITDKDSVSIQIIISGQASGWNGSVSLGISVATSFDAKLRLRHQNMVRCGTNGATVTGGESRVSIDNSEYKYTKATITKPYYAADSAYSSYDFGSGKGSSFNQKTVLDLTGRETLRTTLHLSVTEPPGNSSGDYSVTIE